MYVQGGDNILLACLFINIVRKEKEKERITIPPTLILNYLCYLIINVTDY